MINISKKERKGERRMGKGIRRRKIIGILAAGLLLLIGGYWGVLQYFKIPERDISAQREEYPVVGRDYGGISLKTAQKDYSAIVRCHLQEVRSNRHSQGQMEYAMVVEECLRGVMPHEEFVLCTNGLPKEEAGTSYLLFVEEMPAEWNVERGYSAPEEWTYYITEDELLLSGYTSVYWKENKKWDPAQFDGCSVAHFMKYLEWMI